MRSRLLLLLCLICLAFATSAMAQTTGSVTGVAKDSNGAPLPGVVVTISGPQMPLGRTMTTRSDGVFQFLNLVPGRYQMKAELQGLGGFEQEVIVAVAKDTEVYPVLAAKTTETVTVSAATPLVDTKATDTSNVTPRSTMEKLPLVRTFSGTFQLAPGVADSGVAISNTNIGVNAGGGRQDNTYLYDGVNVTNPFFGDLYQDFAELDIQEVNITRAGATPELGRTGGFIVNGVTKSGTNNLKGDVRLEYQPASFEADSKDPNLSSKFERFRPGVGVGGPLIKDYLFGYGSINYYRANETDRVNSLGTIPNSDLTIHEYFAKLTAQPSTNQLIDGSFRYRGIKQTNADVGAFDAASTADNPDEIDRVGVFSWFWTVNPTWNLEFKYNYDDFPSGASPVTPLPFQPAFNAANPGSVGNYCNGIDCVGANSLLINDDNFRRQEFKLGATFLGQALGASHQVKIGATYSANREVLKRLANGWGAITNSTSSNCGDERDSCYRARWYGPQPEQISKGQTIGFYLQDQATWNRLTLNIGVLVNQDHYIPNDDGQFTFIKGDSDRSELRSLPLRGPQREPARVHVHRHADHPLLEAVAAARRPRVRGGSGRPRQGVHQLRALRQHGQPVDRARRGAGAALPGLELLRPDDGRADRDGPAGEPDRQASSCRTSTRRSPTSSASDTRGRSATAGSAEISGIFRYTKDVIEDFPANDRQTDNPSDFRYGNIPGWRKYRAMTLEVRKAYGSNWTVDVSYTLSRLVGNWDLDYATQLFYSSSYIEDGPGIYVEDPNRTGVLTGNHTNVGKIFAQYQFPFRLNVGGYLRVQTGRPWQAQEFDIAYGTDYQYAEKAGTRTMPTWTNFDLSAYYDFLIGPTTLRLEGRLLNVFNSQPPLTVDPDLYVNTDNTGANPHFGQPTSYAPPRRFIISAIFGF